MFSVCSQVGKVILMGVRIEAIRDSVRIRVTGDIETVLPVPYEDDDRFLVGLSDGTLLIGSYDDDLQCRFDVARDGAGIVQCHNGSAQVDWRIEWATISTYDPNVVEPPAPMPMPLFPEL
jgi:hypothetical protein